LRQQTAGHQGFFAAAHVQKQVPTWCFPSDQVRYMHQTKLCIGIHRTPPHALVTLVHTCGAMYSRVGRSLRTEGLLVGIWTTCRKTGTMAGLRHRDGLGA